MNLRTLLLSTGLVCLFLIPSMSKAQDADHAWEPVGPGIDYRRFHLAGPVVVHVARMDRSNPSLTLESSIAQGSLAEGTETVSEMARRYDQALNFWDQTWGSRNRVVVAINGSYFDFPGVPRRGQIQSGWYAKRFDNYQTGSGFVWKMDGTAFIGECVNHPADGQWIYFLEAGESLRFDGVNVPRRDNELVVYTPHYDRTTRTDSEGVEILVEVSRPLQVMGSTGDVEGVIREIRDGRGSTPIPFDHVVLSAHGSPREALLHHARVEERIGISQVVNSYSDDCVSPIDLDWSASYAGVGGSFYFLKDGEVQAFQENAGARAYHPRTAIAYDEAYIYFIVVDGRDKDTSIGMTIRQLGEFTRDFLGASHAIAQDGGGSSTMVINGRVVNRPNGRDWCDNIELWLPLVMNGDEGGELERNQGQSSSSLNGSHDSAYDEAQGDERICERPVANGMMMVVVEPMESSRRFSVSETIVTQYVTVVRLGPGDNFPVLTVVPARSHGTIMPDDHQLEGVLAKGSYWWKVAIGQVEGWVEEDRIIRWRPINPLPIIPFD